MMFYIPPSRTAQRGDTERCHEFPDNHKKKLHTKDGKTENNQRKLDSWWSLGVIILLYFLSAAVLQTQIKPIWLNCLISVNAVGYNPDLAGCMKFWEREYFTKHVNCVKWLQEVNYIHNRRQSWESWGQGY